MNVAGHGTRRLGRLLEVRAGPLRLCETLRPGQGGASYPEVTVKVKACVLPPDFPLAVMVTECTPTALA
jgi:hypothetical protein